MNANYLTGRWIVCDVCGMGYAEGEILGKYAGDVCGNESTGRDMKGNWPKPCLGILWVKPQLSARLSV